MYNISIPIFLTIIKKKKNFRGIRKILTGKYITVKHIINPRQNNRKKNWKNNKKVNEMSHSNVVASDLPESGETM